MNININDKAPEFTLPDQNGEPVSLKDFRGKWVVLYFYPRADTPGCTIEACEFRDSHKKTEKSGAVVLGVSPDEPKALKKFEDKFDLPFTLLGRCRQESFQCVRRDPGKEHVRQESDGRGADHVHHWAGRKYQKHLPQSEARRPRRRSAHLFKECGKRRRLATQKDIHFERRHYPVSKTTVTRVLRSRSAARMPRITWQSAGAERTKSGARRPHCGSGGLPGRRRSCGAFICRTHHAQCRAVRASRICLRLFHLRQSLLFECVVSA